MSTEYDIEALDSLVETVIDSADGYTESSKTAALSSRKSSSGAVRSAVSWPQNPEQGPRLGGKSEDEGTLLAGAHRMFLKWRSSVSSNDVTVAGQVDAGEDRIRHKSEDAQVDREISAVTQVDIDVAYVVVKAGHDEIRDLDHSLHATQ